MCTTCRSRKLAQTDATTQNHELNLHSLARRISSIHNKPGSLSAACCSQQQPEYQLAGTAATEPRGWKASRAITDLCTWLPGPGAVQLASQTRCGQLHGQFCIYSTEADMWCRAGSAQQAGCSVSKLSAAWHTGPKGPPISSGSGGECQQQAAAM